MEHALSHTHAQREARARTPVHTHTNRGTLYGADCHLRAPASPQRKGGCFSFYRRRCGPRSGSCCSSICYSRSSTALEVRRHSAPFEGPDQGDGEDGGRGNTPPRLPCDDRVSGLDNLGTAISDRGRRASAGDDARESEEIPGVRSGTCALERERKEKK